MLTSEFLYERPWPHDITFKYFVMARGLSSNPINELTVEVLMEHFRPEERPHAVQQQVQQDLLHRAMAHMTLDDAAVELLENVLVVNPAERWTLAQVLESKYVNGD